MDWNTRRQWYRLVLWARSIARTGRSAQRRRQSGSRFQYQPFEHMSYISKLDALSCFLNSFQCATATPFTFESPTFHKIFQHFMAPCHCRRFTEGLHFPFFRKIQKAPSFAAFTQWKTVTVFFLPLCRYTADSPPGVTHALRRNSKYPTNIYTVIPQLERVKEAFLPWFSHFRKRAFFRGITVRISVSSSITLFT